jgi:hypothetical protein
MASNRKTRKLTAKQERFARNVASGLSLMDSYKDAYDAEHMSDKAISVEAARLSNHPRIALLIQQDRAERREREIISEVSDRELVLQKLRVLTKEAGTETVQLNAAIALGRTVALFTDVTRQDDGGRDAATIQRELDDLLAKVEAGSNVVPIRKA